MNDTENSSIQSIRDIVCTFPRFLDDMLALPVGFHEPTVSMTCSYSLPHLGLTGCPSSFGQEWCRRIAVSSYGVAIEEVREVGLTFA